MPEPVSVIVRVIAVGASVFPASLLERSEIWIYPVSVYFTALPNKFIKILLQDPIGNEKTQSSS
jgi:hypothetical protein